MLLMSPANAEVFILEDDPRVIKSLSDWLDRRGHHVVGVASSREEFENKTAKIPFTNRDKAVLVVDGSLDPYGETIADGVWAIALWQQRHPDFAIKTIGWSGSGAIPGATQSFIKDSRHGGDFIADQITEI